MSFNKVLLLGHLTRDPELRFTANQNAICSFGMALNHRFKKADSNEWSEETTFVDCKMFGKRAEAFAGNHQKGNLAFIEGSLRTDSWDDKETGAKRTKMYVVANEFQFVKGRSTETEETSVPDKEDIPF